MDRPLTHTERDVLSNVQVEFETLPDFRRRINKKRWWLWWYNIYDLWQTLYDLHDLDLVEFRGGRSEPGQPHLSNYRCRLARKVPDTVEIGASKG